jgi:hypothetical protein
MKSTPFFVRISMLLAIAMIVNLSACRKKEDLDNDTSSTKNESIAERYFNELQDRHNFKTLQFSTLLRMLQSKNNY